jgi:hypothetical protein
MGFLKKLKKTVTNVARPVTKLVSVPVKAVVKPVAKVATKVIQAPVKAVVKPVAKILPRVIAAPITGGASLVAPKTVIRKAVAVAAPLSALVVPALTGGAGLFVQPKQVGITNADSAALFDRSQQVSRIVAAGATAIGGAVLAAPAIGAAISTGVGSVGTGLATFGKAGLVAGSRLIEKSAADMKDEKLSGTRDEQGQRQNQVTRNKAGRDNPAVTSTPSGGLPPWIWPVGAAVAVVGLLVLRK